ncbi:MAG: Ldh family oxidoreductase [Desulfobacterales bacterium]
MGETDHILVAYDELQELGEKCLELVGVPPDHALITTQVLLWADLRGVGTHGVERLLSYVPRLKKGLINACPALKVEEKGEAIRLLHGDNGLGQVVGERGVREAISLAKKSGLGFVACRDSNHFGAVAPYVLMACQEKIIGIACTNAFATMAPTGGLDSVVGNNPLGIGIPVEGGNHFVLDMAMSVSSRGRIRGMAAKGQTIPAGWAITRQGEPTTDPQEALKGLVLPVGQHKGYGLAVAIDILCGVLTGAGFGTEVKSLFQEWSEPQHIGHVFIALDPRRLMDWESFQRRIYELYRELKSVCPIDPDTPVVVAGEMENRMEKERKSAGIPLPPATLYKLRMLAAGEYEIEISKY